MTTENQNTDRLSYWTRLRTMYRLFWSAKMYKRPAPVGDRFTDIMCAICTFAGILVLSPVLLIIVAACWLWMPFYPAWRAIWLKAAHNHKIHQYLDHVLDKKKTESAE